MTITIAVSGAAAAAVDRVVPTLVDDLVASGITAQVPTLWGPEAEPGAARRLGWTETVATSAGLLDEIEGLRDEFREQGLDHVVLVGTGGAVSLAEAMTRTSGVDLTVLDTSSSGSLRHALADRLERTVLVVSSPSGLALATSRVVAAYEAAFRAAGLDPADRVVLVTDPGSPLEREARSSGWVVFLADETVGGPFSGLTAHGLVPAGLAGADVRELLAEADAVSLELAQDGPANPGLVLGAVLAGTQPLRDTIAVVPDGTHVLGLGEWIQQLVAAAVGSDGKGLLPLVVGPSAAEVVRPPSDVQVVRLVADAEETREVVDGEVEISASFGGHVVLWQYAVTVAARLLGVDPFTEPALGAPETAVRPLLAVPSPVAPGRPLAEGIVGSASGSELGSSVGQALEALLATLPEHGHVAVHSYGDRTATPRLHELRDAIAERTGRPVTLLQGLPGLRGASPEVGDGADRGVSLQVVDASAPDLEVPGESFTFGELTSAQAAADAELLARRGRAVLTLVLDDPSAFTLVLDALR